MLYLAIRNKTNIYTGPQKSYKSFYGDYLSANYLLKNKNINDAVEYLGKIYDIDKTDMIEQNYLATLVLDGQIEKAITIAKNSNCDNFLSNILLAVEQIKSNQYQKAKSILSRYNGFDTDILIIYVIDILCDLSDSDSVTMKEKWDELNVSSEKYNIIKFYEAISLDYLGNYILAEEAFDELFQDSQPIHYIYNAANFYNRIGKTEKAKHLYKNSKSNNLNDKIMINNPTNIISYFLSDISIILANNRLSEQSLIYAKISLYLNDRSDQANYILGNNYFDDMEYNTAIKYYNKIDNNSILHVDSQISIAKSMNMLNQRDDAIKLLNELSLKYQNNKQIMLTISETLYHDKKYDEAINLYNILISNADSIDINDWYIYYLNANCNQMNRNNIEAEKNYIIALSISPNNPIILNDLAYNYAESAKKLEEAFDMANNALKSAPNNPQFLDTIGWVLFKLGRIDESIKYLNDAISLAPNDPIINDHLGDVYFIVGKKNNAIYEWQHAYDNFDDEENKKIIKGKIENGI